MEEFDINNMNEQSLQNLQNDQLVRLVIALRDQNAILKNSCEEAVSRKYDERLERIEREINRDKQYSRRDTVEIVGIDQNIADDRIEEECIKVLKAAKVKIGNKSASSMHIHAAHRKSNKNKVIIKFTNRKFAYASISNRSNLREHNEYKDLYINTSLCPEFSYLNFAVRRAKKNGEIHFFKLKNGITFIQKEEDGEFIEISHENDLERNGLTVPPRSIRH